MNMIKEKYEFKSPASLRTALCAGLIAGATVFAMPQSVSARANTIDPLQLYGPDVVFDVYRKGDRVGQHHITFRRDGDAVVAETRFDVKIKVLALTVYEYLYTSHERWKNGQLISLNARTDDDGDITEINVSRTGYALSVKNGSKVEMVNGQTYPTTHWNAGVLGSTKVINTITGGINNVRIENKGASTVVTGGAERQATHYVYQGDLQTEVWYDAAGRWIKMRFPGTDGTMIEYRCVQCGPMPGVRSGSIGTDTEIARQRPQGD
tara:strand:+ start:307 stop:1101 length:795 start_codon:yes stop_codon:yes gene_type:complete